MRLFQAELAVQLFNDPVTLADRRFKSLTMIQNLNGAAAALDGVVFLQFSKRKSHAWSVGPQHNGQKIMCDWQRRSLDAVLGHHQPARKAWFDIVQPIAGSGLRHLHPLQDGITIQAHLQVGSGAKSGT